MSVGPGWPSGFCRGRQETLPVHPDLIKEIP